MNVASQLGRIVLVLFLTCLIVAVLWQVPWFMTLLLLVPLGLSVLLWPYPSTAVAYLVGAIVGTLFTAWSVLATIENPHQGPLVFLWLPLIWGPAGVLIKRAEVLVKYVWVRSKTREELPPL